MLHIFGRYFFPHIIRGNDSVPDCHIDLTLEMGRRENGAIIFPRGFAKSTWIKLDTLHDIVYALEPVIVFIGNTMSAAQMHFASIRAELENNFLLNSVYKDLVPERRILDRKWTNEHFQTTNGVNVIARGAGKGRGVNVKNQRPTKIIMDDIEDDEQVRSPSRCMKLRHWINSVIIPSLDAKRGFIKMIGTVLAKHAEVLTFYEKYGGIFRRAIEDGKSIWENMWSYTKLMARKKEIGSRAFSREYLNNAIDEESAIIKTTWIVSNTFTTLHDPESLKIVLTMDPQSGESDLADYYSICAVGYYAGDVHRYVLKSMKGRGTKLEQAAALIKAYQEIGKRCWTVGVECIMTQNAVFQNVLEWQAGRINLEAYGVNDDDRKIPIKKLTPTGKSGGTLKDKVSRVEQHESAFERGEIHLHVGQSELADQLSAFPNVEHDDDVDALIYALDESYKSHALPKAVKSVTNRSRQRQQVATFGNLENQTF